MKSQSAGSESVNIGHLSDFRAYWMDSAEYPESNRGNDRVIYPVEVEYEIPLGRRAIVFDTTFTAYIGSGLEDGRIDLEETERIRIDDYHLRFKPAFQTYQFLQRGGSLEIRGTSAKGQKYRVRIRPTIVEP